MSTINYEKCMTQRGRFEIFATIRNGTRVFGHGYAQCVALINLYILFVLDIPLPVGITQARDCWEKYETVTGLHRNFRKSSKPVKGAIMVALGGKYDAKYGHVEVVTHVNRNGTFNTRGQNGSYRYVHKYRRNMSNVLGFLVPR